MKTSSSLNPQRKPWHSPWILTPSSATVGSPIARAGTTNRTDEKRHSKTRRNRDTRRHLSQTTIANVQVESMSAVSCPSALILDQDREA
jgi:hypothetical protein